MSSVNNTSKWNKLPLRTRPHRNPLSNNGDWYPENPTLFHKELRRYYNNENDDFKIEILDVGCAFGGMLMKLCPLLPNTPMLGLEIRPKVVKYAQDRVLEARKEAKTSLDTNPYNNLFYMPLNVMKYGSHCFNKGQLQRIVFCHPDPHWKKSHQRRRIINPGLLPQYAFWLKPSGYLYTVTDVTVLEQYMNLCISNCPLFRELTQKEIDNLPAIEHEIIQVIKNQSEDAQRARRKECSTKLSMYIRV